MHEALIVAFGCGLVSVAICTIPSVTNLASRLGKPQPASGIYEDLDGKSSPEAIKAYSATFPKSVILILTTIGFGISLALALIPILRIAEVEWLVENWLLFTAWVSRLSVYSLCLQMLTPL